PRRRELFATTDTRARPLHHRELRPHLAIRVRAAADQGRRPGRLHRPTDGWLRGRRPILGNPWGGDASRPLWTASARYRAGRPFRVELRIRRNVAALRTE